MRSESACASNLEASKVGAAMTNVRPLLELLGFAQEPRATNVERTRATRIARTYRDSQVSLLRIGPTGDGGQIAREREEFLGWEEELNAPRPMSWPACRPPDGRSCHRCACRHHLRLDLPPPIDPVAGDEPGLAINHQDGRVEVGRRPTLTPANRGAAVDAFIDEAADLSGMRATCTLAVIEQRGAMSEIDVADLLGVDPETVRRETVSGLAKLKELAERGGIGRNESPEDGLIAILGALAARP